MTDWAAIFTRPLHALRLDRIRNRIVALAVLTALIPALVISVVLYQQGKHALADHAAQQLRAASTEAARDADQWLDARLIDLRAATSAYLLPEHIARIRGTGAGSTQALGRLRDNLRAMRERFPDWETVLVSDARGRAAASAGGRAGNMTLSPERLTALRIGDAVVGDPYWDLGFAKPAIVLAVPIRQPDGQLQGVLSAKINLDVVAEILERHAGAAADLFFLTDQGRPVVSTQGTSAEQMRTRIPPTTTQPLLDQEGTPVRYRSADGVDVVGVLRRAPRLGWLAVAEVPQAEVARRVSQLRSLTMVLLLMLLPGVGLVAYGVATLLVRPLELLSGAAARVAAGDLAVELPVGGSGEVGHLTRTFAHLVSRLRERESQGELEKLSVTDPLTGLYNRRHLMGTLANEVQRSRRLRRTFSVLLADVDHFKRYNDTHGHLAGDAALVKIAELLRKTTRGVDSVARYGGEEFLVMLLEAPLATATLVAERIRSRIAAEAFDGGKRATLSIGVAEYPTHGDTPEELIASADAAMYRAKSGGRDAVVVAGGPPEGTPERRRKSK